MAYMRVLLLLITTVSLVACAGEKEAQPVDEPEVARERSEPDHPITFDLHVGRDGLEPEPGLWLAIRFKMEPGWKIYWHNPGESGLPTKVEVEAPAGIEVGPVHYPGPSSFKSPGEILSYGYKKETALLVPLSPSAEESGPVLVKVAASWLACEELCIQGRGQAEIELPDGAEIKSTVVERYLPLLPRPSAELEGVSVEMVPSGEGAELLIRVADAQSLEFFPARSEALQLSVQSRQNLGAATELKVRFREREGGSGDASKVRGVLAVQSEKGSSYFEILASRGGS